LVCSKPVVIVRWLIVSAGLIWLTASAAPAIADDGGSSGSTAAQLSTLENRFFFHQYTNESDDKRLDRLERLIFGHTRSGSQQDRLNSLQIAIPADGSSPAANSSPSDTASSKDRPRPSVPGDPNVDFYPTVTALENEIEGATYKTLPIQERLVQLETKAFGRPSDSDDLSKRVDALKQYIAEKGGKTEDYLSSSPPTFNSQRPGMNQQVGSLEQVVLGKTYDRDGLVSRINRLEKTVFPKEPLQTFNPVTARVNRLTEAIYPGSATTSSGAPSPLASDADITNDDDDQLNGAGTTNSSTNQYSQHDDRTPMQSANTSPKGHPILRNLGTVVGGLGVVAARAVGSLATGMSYPGYGYGGYPGYGGLGGLGGLGGYGGYPGYAGMGGLGGFGSPFGMGARFGGAPIYGY
jgi:hypothetical protein